MTTTQPSCELSSPLENVSDSSNSSEKEKSKNNYLTEIRDILLFRMEEEMLQQMMDELQSICGCECCLMDRLKKAYQEAREKLKLYPQSSNVNNETIENWFKNFEERYKDIILVFPFRCDESMEKQPILTFEEELSLLKDIQENCTRADCICQECILREVSISAYKLAFNTNIPYPESWTKHKKAGSRWLKDFKVKHNIFFLSFPTTCKLTSSQSSMSGSPTSFTENESLNSSQKEISESNIPIEIKDILLFIKEEEILKQMMDNKQSVCGCECCLTNRLKKVYQKARKELILYPQSSNMDKEAVKMWFKNFEDRHKNEISKFPSRCKLSKEAITKQSILSIKNELLLMTKIKANSTTEDCICQECLLKKISFLVYKVASYNNIPYPKSWKKHKRAESQWMKDFTERHKNKISKFPLICKLISEETIETQCSSKVIFTFIQERSLLVDLEANSSKEDCICQKCVLEKLPFLVYKLACEVNLKNRAKQFPKPWNRYKKVGQQWVKEYIKRHEKEFAKLSFPCKINPSESSMKPALI